jgi:L-alanine-DL-glutamate epimerase-like enolase superfamily enzyme
MHSGGSLGIATAAAVHTLSTISNNVLASQTYAQFMGGDVVKEDVNHFVNGCLSPFEQPGLGVTLDVEKLAYYHEVYLRGDVVDGSYRREDMSQEVSAGNLYYPKY